MRSVLLIIPAHATPAKLKVYVAAVAESTTAAVSVCPADELSVQLAPDQFIVYDHHNERALHEYDLVIFRGTIDRIFLANVACQYLAEHGVRFFNDYRSYKAPNKLLQAVDFYRQGVPFPRLIYAGKRQLLQELMSDTKLLPAVVKCINGSKGRDNYLVESLADFVAIERRPGRIAFLAQQYIPNDGDYRLLFFGSELVVRYRRNAVGGHLHNYAHGATMHSVPTDDLPASAVAAARDIVQASGLTVAGIDMVIDSATGQYYFLEINAQPGWGKLKDDIRAPLARLLTE